MEYIGREVRNDILTNLSCLSISQKKIGEMVNLSQQMVSKLLGKFQNNEPLTTKRVGAVCRLSADNLKELPILLSKGAEFHGFEGAYWTQARVGVVIKEHFHVSYSDKQVGRILEKINWTRQKPQKKDAKQDLAKVEKWQTEELPALKKSDRGRF
jgi:transposase